MAAATRYCRPSCHSSNIFFWNILITGYTLNALARRAFHELLRNTQGYCRYMLPPSAAVNASVESNSWVTQNDSVSQKSTRGMRTQRRLTVVNRRQKGVFAPSQNKTKQVEKIPKERTFGRPRRPKVAQKSSPNKDGHFGGVTRSLPRTFWWIVNSVVAGA